jgi:hyperosmotically inducible periplasmic protein
VLDAGAARPAPDLEGGDGVEIERFPCSMTLHPNARFAFRRRTARTCQYQSDVADRLVLHLPVILLVLVVLAFFTATQAMYRQLPPRRRRPHNPDRIAVAMSTACCVFHSSLEKVIMNKALWIRLAFALAAAAPIAACTASTPTTDSTGQYVDDSAITTKVKTALLGDTGLKSFDISVTTSKDVVQLSGVVNSDHLRARATDVAAGIAGVRGVVNNLAVR